MYFLINCSYGDGGDNILSDIVVVLHFRNDITNMKIELCAEN